MALPEDRSKILETHVQRPYRPLGIKPKHAEVAGRRDFVFRKGFKLRPQQLYRVRWHVVSALADIEGGCPVPLPSGKCGSGCYWRAPALHRLYHSHARDLFIREGSPQGGREEGLVVFVASRCFPGVEPEH